MKKRGLSKSFMIVAVLAAAALGYLFLRPGAAPPLAFETARVERGDLATPVLALGTLSPVVTIEVGSQISGRVQHLYADFNSRVTEGQVIARIDPRLIQSDVQRSRAQVAAARAQVKRAEAELVDAKRRNERAAALASQRLLSQAEADTANVTFRSAEAQLASARASLLQARAALEQSETNLAFTTIVSPIDGIVISRDVDVGQTVAASLQAPVLFTIAGDLTRMELHTNVAEADVGRLESGMPVEFSVDAYPERRFDGVVKEVRYSPQTVQNVVTYDAVVAVANPELKLRPGMTADVAFLVETREDVLKVGNAALRFRPPPALLGRSGPQAGARGAQGASRGGGAAARPTGARGGAHEASGGRPRTRAGAAQGGDAGGDGDRTAPGHRVWRMGPDGEVTPVQVATGISDGRFTEIVSGLSEGDRVVTAVESGGADGPPGQGRRRRRGSFL